MPIADLLKNPTIKRIATDDPVRGLTTDYVQRRARRRWDTSISSRDPDRPGDLTAEATAEVLAAVLTELPLVKAAHTEIARRVHADREHLDVRSPTILDRVSTRPPVQGGDPRLMRRNHVATIVYQALAADPTLADPSTFDLRLHPLCDRRLRLVERMLYDVGRVEKSGRQWSRRQIAADPGGPWFDGKDRIFEYPRLPVAFFLGACDPDLRGVCRWSPPGWRQIDGELIKGPMRTNTATVDAWPADPKDDSKFNLFYKPGVLPDAVTAVQDLFIPARDFLSRNLLFCDQVIHILHLEALVFSRQKRLPTVRTWLDDERLGQPEGWLRISSIFLRNLRFLGSDQEPRHFEHVTVRAADLQPGDHVIVYNHPAYDIATVEGAWRLENAVVVQTLPRLLMQGHGSLVHDMDGMKRDMVTLFNRELAKRQADVDGMATVVANLGGSDGANRVQVSTVELLQRGMQVTVADRDANSEIAANRKITAIDHANRIVTFDGLRSTSTRAGHVLRRPRVLVSGGFEEITGVGTNIRRRRQVHVPSGYAGRHQRADWYLYWDAPPDEEAIARNPQMNAFVRQQQLVEYEPNPEKVSPDDGKAAFWGWFPLFRPSTDGNHQPRRRADGLIDATEPQKVGPQHVDGWTWFKTNDPAKRDRVAAVRPVEP